jgi:hypothetical protein
MQNKISPAIAALIVIVMIGAATAGVAAISNQNSGTAIVDGNTVPAQSGTANSPSAEQRLKDGTYSSDGIYSTPGGKQSIGLTVTLKDDIIQEVDLEQQATGGDTAIYQAKFASGYKPLVQGKNINDVKLTRVAGSSLTSNGFNEALESIKRDAAS